MKKDPDHQGAIQKLFADAQGDLVAAFARASEGIATNKFTLGQVVEFTLDEDTVKLKVREIEIQHAQGQVLSLQVRTQTDFKNVLKLTQKLKMKISAFNKQFTVHLRAKPEFLVLQQPHLLEIRRIEDFFEAQDQLKRPIYLNIGNYIIERISQ